MSAQPDSWWYRTRKLAARRRIETVAALVAVLGLVVGAGVAMSQARVAATERDFARRQLMRSQSINDLNEFLLADAAPQGTSFTAAQVLARAERIAERQQSGSLEARVETLVTIGGQYLTQALNEHAQRVLGRAYELSRTSTDPSIRSKAACTFAAALANAGEDARARTIVQGALTELPPDAAYDLDRVTCELDAGEIARHGADPETSLAHVTSAEAILASSGLGSPVLNLRVSMDLASSYRVADRYLEAMAMWDTAFTQLVALGRDDTETAGTLLNDWALALHLLGQPLEAEQRFRRAVEIASTDGSEAGVSPTLLTNLARTLLELGRVSEAVAMADRAAVTAERNGNVVVVNQGLLTRASAYRQAGNLDRATALLDELERRVTGVIPAGHQAFAGLAVGRSLVAFARGQMQEATAAIDRAVSMYDSPDADRRDAMPRALVVRSTFALADGRVEPALADAERAVSVTREMVDPRVMTSHLGRAYLALGAAQHAAGRTDAARSALTSALQHLQPSLGSDHAETQQARRLLTTAPGR